MKTGSQRGQLRYPKDKLAAAQAAGYNSYDEAIEDMYDKKDMTTTEIGKVLGVSFAAIRYRMIYLNLKRREAKPRRKKCTP